MRHRRQWRALEARLRPHTCRTPRGCRARVLSPSFDRGVVSLRRRPLQAHRHLQEPRRRGRSRRRRARGHVAAAALLWERDQGRAFAGDRGRAAVPPGRVHRDLLDRDHFADRTPDCGTGRRGQRFRETAGEAQACTTSVAECGRKDLHALAAASSLFEPAIEGGPATRSGRSSLTRCRRSCSAARWCHTSRFSNRNICTPESSGAKIRRSAAAACPSADANAFRIAARSSK